MGLTGVPVLTEENNDPSYRKREFSALWHIHTFEIGQPDSRIVMNFGGLSLACCCVGLFSCCVGNMMHWGQWLQQRLQCRLPWMEYILHCWRVFWTP